MTTDEECSKPAANMGIESSRMTSKLGALCFYSTSVLDDKIVLQNPTELEIPRYLITQFRIISNHWILHSNQEATAI